MNDINWNDHPAVVQAKIFVTNQNACLSWIARAPQRILAPLGGLWQLDPGSRYALEARNAYGKLVLIGTEFPNLLGGLELEQVGPTKVALNLKLGVYRDRRPSFSMLHLIIPCRQEHGHVKVKVSMPHGVILIEPEPLSEACWYQEA